MRVLYELPTGYLIVNVTPKQQQRVAMFSFKTSAEASEATTKIRTGKMHKSLKKFIAKNLKDGQLGVSDTKLAASIQKKFPALQVCANDEVDEMMRIVREKISALCELGHETLQQASLGLAHTLNRHTLKFSAEKLDVMVIQAVGLLDDLDKELNNYQMRVKEWFGWHFPEMGKVVGDNMQYCRVVLKCGNRTGISRDDLSDVLAEEVEAQLKAATVHSMGVALSPMDEEHVKMLCTEVVQTSEYRAQLYDYLKVRMQAIAPNLSAMVGELVGARLLAHAGSLVSLAKSPASTIQLLGAEKALFRALKKKHETPKYGLLFHASLVGQAPTKSKGKMARMLGNKTALCTRFDAFTETTRETGLSGTMRGKLEVSLRQMQGDQLSSISASGANAKRQNEDDGGANKRQKT